MRRNVLIGIVGLATLSAFTTGCWHGHYQKDAIEAEIAQKCVAAANAGRPAVYVIPQGTVLTTTPGGVQAVPAPAAPAAPH